MKTVSRLSVPVLAMGALIATGCSSDNSLDMSFDAIAGNLTPNLMGIQQRSVDIDRHVALAQNANRRMLSDDINRFFYTAHSSRLSPFPIAFPSGQPR